MKPIIFREYNKMLHRVFGDMAEVREAIASGEVELRAGGVINVNALGEKKISKYIRVRGAIFPPMKMPKGCFIPSEIKKKKEHKD